MAPNGVIVVRVHFHTVVNSAPPHAAVLECDPEVTTWAIKQGPQCIEALGRHPLIAKVSSQGRLDRRQIAITKQLAGHTTPSGVHLAARLRCSPPASARTV